MPASLALRSIRFVRDGRTILDGIDFAVHPGERWLVMGANGSGKTSLVRIAAMYEHPSAGSVTVLGESLGTTDVRVLRRRIGYLSASFAAGLRSDALTQNVVMTAKNAALETWWHHYDAADRRRARECLDRFAVGELAGRPFGTLSSGEQQRVLLARTLMNDPGIVLLDEPSARLDLAGRENLLQALGELALDTTAPPLVLVTHHVDEIPRGMTHVLYLANGRVMNHGPIDTMMDANLLSQCFGVDLSLQCHSNGRFTAWAR